MNNENFVLFKVVYIDKHFAKLSAVEEFDGYTFFEKTSALPNNSQLGDILKQYYDKDTKTFSYEIFEEANLLQEDNDYTEWVVSSLLNHTICLTKFDDFNTKLFIPDTRLKLNAQVGDIYLLKDEKFYFDQTRNNDLCLLYAKMFDELDNSNDIKIMQTIDQDNSNIFKESCTHEFKTSYCIEKIEETLEDGVIFRISDNEGNFHKIHSKKLPKFARVADFIGMTEEQEFYFDREALLAHLNELNAFGGESWVTVK